MSKTKIALASTAVLGAYAAWKAFCFIGSEAQLMEDHPDIDPAIVIKAHRQLVMAALKGTDPAIENAQSDADFEKIFLDKVATLTK